MRICSIVNVKSNIVEMVVGQIHKLRIEIRTGREGIIEIIIADSPEIK